MALCRDQSGTLWVGTRNGLNRLDRTSGRFLRYRHDPALPESLINNVVMSCHVDQAGIIWIGTEGGLDAFDPEQNRFTHYIHDADDPHSLVDDRARALFQDRSGLLWIGTYRGISVLHTPPKFVLYRNTENTLNGNYIRALLADGEGALWIGTNEGLARYDRHRRSTRFWFHDAQDPAGIDAGLGLNVIYRDRMGRVWLGGWGTGLERLDPTTDQFTHYRHQDAVPYRLSHNTIFSIHQDRQDRLWIGTAKGLNLFNPATGEFRAFHHDPHRPGGLAGPDVRVIFEDDGGVLWLGSRFNGITRFDPGPDPNGDPNGDPSRDRFKIYSHDPDRSGSIASNSITSILQDRTGTLWFGTAAGLSRWDERSNAFVNDPLSTQGPAERVHCILEDAQGQLWLSTDRGLGQYDPGTKTLTRYTSIDGLQDRLFTDGACARDTRGAMFFGGGGGINGFHPAAVRKDTVSPPIVLTDLRIMGEPLASGPDAPLQKPLWQTDRIVLPFDRNTLALEFTALDYADPRQNRYRYRLEGYETGWHDTNGSRRTADYANLPPGDYVFRVHATNHDGVWSTHSLSLAVTLTPPWWDTWLFRGATLMALGALLSGVYRWRTHTLLAQSQRLEVLVQERTTELRDSERRLHDVIANNIDGMIVVDRDGAVRFINPAAAALLGKSRDELDGRPLGLPITRTDGTATEIELVHGAGDAFPAEQRATRIQWMDRPAYLITLRDITERRRLERELQQQATTDELTAVFNRRHFLQLARQELQRALRSRHPTAVALIDLDHFKDINDTHGHAIGDRALLHLTRIIKETIRTSDVLARFGGDEFVLLLPETDSTAARALFERVHEALAMQPLDLGDRSVAITISVGIASSADASASIDALVARADRALYRAKQAGRKRTELA